MNLITLIRYRFFFFAGFLPYLLGQAIAFGVKEQISWLNFWLGFIGISLILAAVELFNEYFDAKEGGDRIFSPEQPKIPAWFFGLGILACGLALVVGFYLFLQTGWPVLFFCVVGFLGAYFYVGPPVRWAYRGFGELVIALCYGPFMVLGSYYIQAQSINIIPFVASVTIGLSVFCLAILNEIPDYYQDALVGKRNLVVRLGKQKALVLLKLGLVAVFLFLALFIALKLIPFWAILAVVTLPWLIKGIRGAEKNYDNPEVFRFAVNTFVISHIVIVVTLGVSFLGYH